MILIGAHPLLVRYGYALVSGTDRPAAEQPIQYSRGAATADTPQRVTTAGQHAADADFPESIQAAFSTA